MVRLSSELSGKASENSFTVLQAIYQGFFEPLSTLVNHISNTLKPWEDDWRKENSHGTQR